MIIHDCLQGTDDRFDCRKGKMTASHATAIGNAWKWLETYIIDLMSEYYSTGDRNPYTNENIDRWKELEPLARDLYELTTWTKVQEVGFIEYNEYVWCSPDWLVWDTGWIEIKSQGDKKHFQMLLDWKIDSWYIRQVQMNLLITKRDWRDFISYNPNYEKSLIVQRIYPDQKKFEQLEQGFLKGIELILDIKKTLWTL